MPLANIKTITKRELGGLFFLRRSRMFSSSFSRCCAAFSLYGMLSSTGLLSLPFFDWHPGSTCSRFRAAYGELRAEERRVGTIELLLTMPITAWQAIVGNFGLVAVPRAGAGADFPRRS